MHWVNPERYADVPEAEAQSDARYRLVQSATMARNDGFSFDEWSSADVVTQLCSDSGLPLTILDHIYHWVWRSMK